MLPTANLAAGKTDTTTSVVSSGTKTVTLSALNGDNLTPYQGTGLLQFPSSGNADYTVLVDGGNYIITPATTGGCYVKVVYSYVPASKGYVTYAPTDWQGKTSTAAGWYAQTFFNYIYPNLPISIGSGGKVFTFDDPTTLQAFMPQTGTDTILPGSQLDSTDLSRGKIASNLLSVKLAIAFSDAGIFRTGLGELVIQSGPLKGVTARNAAALADALIAGNAIPAGLPKNTLAQADTALSSITYSFHGSSVKPTGFLQ